MIKVNKRSGFDKGAREPRQARSRAKRDAILASAASLIGVRGLAQVSMRDIASGARVSVGAIYQYFPSRADVVRALVEDYNRTIRSLAASAAAGIQPDTPAELAVMLFLKPYLAFQQQAPAYHQVLLAEATAEGRACGSTELSETLVRVVDDLLSVRAPKLTTTQRYMRARMFIDVARAHISVISKTKGQERERLSALAGRVLTTMLSEIEGQS